MPATPDSLPPALAEWAADWLLAAPGLENLSRDDALVVAGYMQPHRVGLGEYIVREGQTEGADRLWLVLQGELSVESRALQAGEAEMVVRVMGPGSLIGELSLLDGGPRSADCVADTDIVAVSLGRADFVRLLTEQPQAGIGLLLAMAQRMAGHVRDLTRKVQLFAQMNRTLNQALESGPVPEPGLHDRFEPYDRSGAVPMPERPDPHERISDWPAIEDSD